MTKNDVAHIYDEAALRSSIEGLLPERDFWFGMMEKWPHAESHPYYTSQYEMYNGRIRDLRNLLKEMVYDR